MLERFFKRRDVTEFIDEVISNSIYSKKKNSVYDSYEVFVDSSQALFTFFDAIYKFAIIIEDEAYFTEYIMQIRKVIKKFENFNDINEGINKIIGKICALKLGLSDREDVIARKYIVKYVYDKYIVSGYVFHGFPSIYKDDICKYGLVPDNYHHMYDKFIEINKIFERHGFYNVLGKDFKVKGIYFTDSFILGCFYAFSAPMYFYRLLGCNSFNISNYDDKAYLNNDYFASFNNLSLLVRKAKLTEAEKKFVIKTCFEEWKLIKNSTDVSILAIKRSSVGLNYLKNIDDILAKTSFCDLGNSIGKIFNYCDNEILVTEKISSNDINIISLNNYKELKSIRDMRLNDIKNRQEAYNSDKIINAYGKVSILMILGSLLITLGVIATIVMFYKG